MEDMQFNTPQDKLLVMLVERMSALEDEQTKLRQAIEQSNKNLEHLWIKNTSCYYSVSLKLKNNFNTRYEHTNIGENNVSQYGQFVRRQLDSIKDIINDAFQCKLYCNRSVTNFELTLYFEFENRITIDTLMDKLDLPFSHYVMSSSWRKLSKDNMTHIIRTIELVQM